MADANDSAGNLTDAGSQCQSNREYLVERNEAPYRVAGSEVATSAVGGYVGAAVSQHSEAELV
jgi:hypothetical protein